MMGTLVAKRKANASKPPAQIHVGAPQVQLTLEMKELANEVSQLTAVMTRLAKQQESILKAIEQQSHVIGVLANREVSFKADLPTITIPEIKIPPMKMPQRPSAFDVEFEKEGGQTVGMRIRAAGH
jgi:hypothetical protein